MTVFNLYVDRRFDSSTPGQAPDPADIDHWRLTIDLLGGSTGGEWTINLNESGPLWRQYSLGPFTISGSSDIYDFQMPELASTYYGYNCEAHIYYTGDDGPADVVITIPADPIVPEFTVSNLTPAVGDVVTITPIAKSKQATSFDGIVWFEQDTSITIPVEGLQTTNATTSYWSVIGSPVNTSYTVAGTYGIAGYVSSFYTSSYNSITGPQAVTSYYIYYSQEVTVTGGGGVAIVSYGTSNICHDITVNRPVYRGGRARGLSVVGGEFITFTDIDIQDSQYASIYISSESEYTTNYVDGVSITGGKITRSSTGSGHPSILFYNSNLGISNSSVSGVDIYSQQGSAGSYISAYDPPITGCSVSNIRVFDTGRSLVYDPSSVLTVTNVVFA
jgi:hypothetical protein